MYKPARPFTSSNAQPVRARPRSGARYTARRAALRPRLDVRARRASASCHRAGARRSPCPAGRGRRYGRAHGGTTAHPRRQGRPRGRGDPGRGPRHRGRAGRAGRHRLRDGAQHPRRGGPSTTGRRPSRRPPSWSRRPAATASPCRPTIWSRAGQALVDRIDGEQGRLDVLVNDIWGGEPLFEWDSPVWEHDLDKGLRLLRLAVETHADHQPLRAAAAAARAGRAGGRDDRRHRRVQRAPLPGVVLLRPRQVVGRCAWPSRSATSSARAARPRWR